MSLELPTILTTPAASFPKVRVSTVDVIGRSLVFDWLDADENKVDSGGSVARLPGQAEFDGEEPIDPTEAELVDAITNPPAMPVVLSQPAEIVAMRMTDAEIGALDTSTDARVRRFKMVALSNGIVSQAHPMFADGTQLLHALNIINLNRWPVLLAP